MTTDNIFDNCDEEISVFLDQLIQRTENNYLFWRPISRYISDCEDNPYKYEDYVFYPDCYNNIIEMINSKTTVKFYEDESFYIQKKDSLIFLIHIMQHSQLTNKNDDNYLLYGAANVGGILMHICGLTKETEIEISNAQKLKQLCDCVKRYDRKWIDLDGGGLGPMSFMIKNILSD